MREIDKLIDYRLSDGLTDGYAVVDANGKFNLFFLIFYYLTVTLNVTCSVRIYYSNILVI